MRDDPEAVQIMGYYRAALVDGNLYYTELGGQQACFLDPQVIITRVIMISSRWGIKSDIA